jgi:hypothetical protein
MVKILRNIKNTPFPLLPVYKETGVLRGEVKKPDCQW